MAMESAAQRFRGAEPQPAGDGVEGIIRLGERAASRLDANAFDVCRGRNTDLGGEAALEVTRAETGTTRQLVDAVPPAGRGVDGIDGGADRVAGRLRRPQRDAELRLTARPAQEHHQLTGHPVRDLPAEVVLDQREREVHPGRHARRGPEPAVPD